MEVDVGRVDHTFGRRAGAQACPRLDQRRKYECPPPFLKHDPFPKTDQLGIGPYIQQQFFRHDYPPSSLLSVIPGLFLDSKIRDHPRRCFALCREPCREPCRSSITTSIHRSWRRSSPISWIEASSSLRFLHSAVVPTKLATRLATKKLNRGCSNSLKIEDPTPHPEASQSIIKKVRPLSLQRRKKLVHRAEANKPFYFNFPVT